jgi:hypothetical protein
MPTDRRQLPGVQYIDSPSRNDYQTFSPHGNSPLSPRANFFPFEQSPREEYLEEEEDSLYSADVPLSHDTDHRPAEFGQTSFIDNKMFKDHDSPMINMYDININKSDRSEYDLEKELKEAKIAEAE